MNRCLADGSELRASREDARWRIDYFLRTFPYAYHVSLCPEPRTITATGLLSAASLLDACNLPREKRERLVCAQRPLPEPLQTVFGPALLNDQKPLPAVALQKCVAGMSAGEWYTELSERIFFFLSDKKARTFAKVRAKMLPARTLFVFDMTALTSAADFNFDLCAFNSGNAMRKPISRNRESFQTLSEYPLVERRRKYGIERAVAEMSTRRRHLNIAASLIETIAL
jgi:hypothetical protein